MTDTPREQNQGNLGPDQHQGNRPGDQQTPDTGADKNQNPNQPRNREEDDDRAEDDRLKKDDRQGIDPAPIDSPRQAE